MEKYAVVQDDEKTKTAEVGGPKKCPKCGREAHTSSGLLWCPECGTEPFEKKP